MLELDCLTASIRVFVQPRRLLLSCHQFFHFLYSSVSSQEHSSSTPHTTTTNERHSSTSDSPPCTSVSKQTHEDACICSSTSQAVAASTLSSSGGSGLFSLRRSVLKSVLTILVIAVISQLLVISGDVETNPGPAKHRGEQAPPGTMVYM